VTTGPEPLVQLHDHDHDQVVVVQLNRPDKLNALSTTLEQTLLDTLGSSPVRSARAIVFTGTERAFSAGADTSELPHMTPERIAAYYRGSGSVYDVIAHMPQPTLAAISGYCLGAGFELALACDVRIADNTAQFGLPEIRLGILPSSGGITRLVRAVGSARTKEIVLFGDRFSAHDAHRYGLLREIAPAGQAVDTAVQQAAQLASLPSTAVAWTKAAIAAAAESSTAVSLLVEQLAYAALNRTSGEPTTAKDKPA
jgi:enoyl-CoA hydratase/carnithine racemase